MNENTETKSSREIQLEELEALLAIYPDILVLKHPNCRPDVKSKEWKPMAVDINIVPFSCSKGSPTNVGLTLCIRCSRKYPRVIPDISITNIKGLKASQTEEINALILREANEQIGNAMIFNLVQKVQEYLSDKYMSPRNEQLEKLKQEQKEREILAEMRKRQEDEERNSKLVEIERKKEEYDLQSSYWDNHDQDLFPDDCDALHKRSHKLTFPSERAITRSKCTNHLRNGGVSYVGIEMPTGKPLWMVEFNIKNSQLKAKCSTSAGECLWNKKIFKCSGNHCVEDIIDSIQEQVRKLSTLAHRNIVQYKEATLTKRKYGLQIYLIYEYIRGLTVSQLSKSFRPTIEDVRLIASGILKAMNYLHNNGFLYGNLCMTNVLIDVDGTVRCSDYSLVPKILQLTSESRDSITKSDFLALAMLLQHLTSSSTPEFADFIHICTSETTQSAAELLDHPFLKRPTSLSSDSFSNIQNRQPLNQLATREHEDKPQRLGQLMPLVNVVSDAMPSRLLSDFDALSSLGNGAFGSVIKAQNRTDSRSYAIKCIVLKKASEGLLKKMTREVSLLSRLYHENVVRYFNSWIERVDTEKSKELSRLLFDGSTLSDKSASDDSDVGDKLLKKAGISSKNILDNLDRYNVQQEEDSDSDIEFIYPDGEKLIEEDLEDDESSDEDTKNTVVYAIYIQMEYCENFTLRTAIDLNLYKDKDKVWRFLREIAEGLAYIHKQGIIHRDLKPANIFLDKQDQIKIGDFGLATTSFLAAQAAGDLCKNLLAVSSNAENGTGRVGTELYVAPELHGKASKSRYDQKVDIYTLGIILFEMCNPRFETGMERIEVIMKLRQNTIELPEGMLADRSLENEVKIIRLLLNHDASKRPSAEELLSNELVSSIQIDDSQMQDLFRNVLAKPKSKLYRDLMSRCLAQKGDDILQDTYYFNDGQTRNARDMVFSIDDGVTSLDPIVEHIESKFVEICHKHGAIKVNIPLLTPLTENTKYMNQAVRLMTQYGSVVLLPANPRAQLAQLVAKRGVHYLCSYSTSPIYREQKAYNCHPREQNICTFDIISSQSTALLEEDAEVLSVAYDFIYQILKLRDKLIEVRICHMSLLHAIFVHCGVPPHKYIDVMNCLTNYKQGRIKKTQFENFMLDITKQRPTSVYELATHVSAITTNDHISELLSRPFSNFSVETKKLAQESVNNLQTFISLIHAFGVKCTMYIDIGIGIQQKQFDVGIIWQISVNFKRNGPTVLAVGERYDSMLQEFQRENIKQLDCAAAGVGTTIFLDKLICHATPGDCERIDIGICVVSTRSKKACELIRNLLKTIRSMELRFRIFKAERQFDDMVKLLQSFGASIVLTIFGDGSIKSDITQELKFLHIEASNIEESLRSYFANHVCNITVAKPKENIDLIMLASQMKRSREASILKYLKPKIAHLSDLLEIKVLVTELPANLVNALIAAINPAELQKTDLQSIVASRSESRMISEIYERVNQFYQHEEKPMIVILSVATTTSFYHRILI